jgi:Nucleolar complex-associated protein
LKFLLSFLTDKQPIEVAVTVPRLAAVSLLEVFKDLLPEYQIKNVEDVGVKRKFKEVNFWHGKTLNSNIFHSEKRNIANENGGNFTACFLQEVSGPDGKIVGTHCQKKRPEESGDATSSQAGCDRTSVHVSNARGTTQLQLFPQHCSLDRALLEPPAARRQRSCG